MSHPSTAAPAAQPYPFEDLECLLEVDWSPSEEYRGELERGYAAITDWLSVAPQRLDASLYRRAFGLRMALIRRADEVTARMGEASWAQILEATGLPWEDR